MSKIYIFAFDLLFGTISDAKALVESMPYISAWRYDMQQCMYLVSTYDAGSLSGFIRGARPQGMFIIAEISSDVSKTNGWITQDSWYLIQHKVPKPQPPPSPTSPANPWLSFDPPKPQPTLDWWNQVINPQNAKPPPKPKSPFDL
jgi:hypothetical protein